MRAQLKKDASNVEFNLPLKAHEKRQFSYDVTTNFGLNATGYVPDGCETA